MNSLSFRPLQAFGVSVRSATRLRLLVLLMALSALPALFAAIPFALAVGIPLQHHPQGGEWPSSIDSDTWLDVLRSASETGANNLTAFGAVVSMLLALVLSPIAAGLTVSQIQADRALSFRALMVGSGEWFGRMFRLGLASILPLAAAGALLAGLNVWLTRATSHALTETRALRMENAFMGAAFASLGLVFLSVDAGRAVFAASPHRRSAFLAWTSGAWLVMRRPLSSIAFGSAGLAMGLLAALALTYTRNALPAAAVPFSVLLAAGASVAIAWGRSVRLGFLTALARHDLASRAAKSMPNVLPSPPKPFSVASDDGLIVDTVSDSVSSTTAKSD